MNQFKCAHCGTNYKSRKPTQKYCRPACYFAAKPRPLAERFWKQVNKTETCWIWTSTLDPDGYGHIKRKVKTRPIGAHRISWELHKGPIPEGLQVLHKCDMPSCVRPDHLFLGSAAENVADMVSKNRQAKGEQQANAKLTEADVNEIRTSFAGGQTHAELAARFHVSRAAIYDVCIGKTWKHVV